jgi:glycosyltransferase involved in cell wall biosynthesis
MPPARPSTLVFLPPGPWLHAPTSADPDARPDPAGNRRALAELGVATRVLNPTGFPWNPFGRAVPYLRGLDPLRALRVLLAHRRADAVVCVTETPGLVLLLLRRLFLFRPKVVLWDASPGNPWRFLQRVQRFVFPRYDGLMMLTSAQVDAIATAHRVRGRLFHLGHYTDEAFYHPRHRTGEDYVLSVGDDLSRDYPTLMDAVRGTPEAVVVKTKWRPPADQSAGLERVTFRSERLDDRAFRGLYAGARVVVVPLLPITTAGGINGLFEAMAMGKAVVVTESAITRDFVTPGETAVVVPPGDPAALRAALEELCNDPAKRAELGRNARRAIEERFSSRALAERMAAFVAGL